MQMRLTKNALGWDMSFVTNHLGPFALTEALVPSLPNGANVAFVVSAVEDPERRPAVAAGFRGGRYISAEASARGEWKPGGAQKPGFDAYATSKQAVLAAVMAFARETPRLHFNAIEPGYAGENFKWPSEIDLIHPWKDQAAHRKRPRGNLRSCSLANQQSSAHRDSSPSA
jgi:NAD(P)-dependent dehydrogenase (short-subunit alcohol dehydrogenase family)